VLPSHGAQKPGEAVAVAVARRNQSVRDASAVAAIGINYKRGRSAERRPFEECAVASQDVESPLTSNAVPKSALLQSESSS